LLLGDALAGSLLGGRLAISTFTVGAVSLRGGLLLRATLLRSRHGTAFRSGERELALDLGPRIGCGARVAHAGEVCKLVVVDLQESVPMRGGSEEMAYLRRAGLQRLHSPGQHLHLSLREGGGSSIVVTSFRHCGGVGGVLVGCWWDRVAW